MDTSHLMEYIEGCPIIGITFVGVAKGIFHYIWEKGKASTKDIAQGLCLNVEYLEKWAEAAWAYGVLEYQQGKYTLSHATAEQFFQNGSPTHQSVPVLSGMFQMLMSYEVVSQMESGKQPGFDLFSRYPDFGKLFGWMLEGSLKPILEKEILIDIKAYDRVGKIGGKVLDVGCGNGWFLLTLAEKYPFLRGVGIDDFENSISFFMKKVEERQLVDRIRVELANINTFTCGEREFDMVCLNFVLHHIWEKKKEVMAKINQALKPGGVIAIWEYDYPEIREKLKEPPTQFLAFKAMAEHVLKGQYLQKRQIEKTIQEAGFESKSYSIKQGMQCSVIGQKQG